MNLLRRWPPRLLTWGFGGVFVWSGWLKLQDPALFLISVRSFRLLPDPYAAWLALALPWLEVLAGLAVITGLLRRGGLLLLNGALLTFAAALLTALVRGLDVECGCFGTGTTTTLHQALLRAALLLALGGWLLKRG